MRKNIQKKRRKAPVLRRQTSVSVSEENRTFTVVVPGRCQPKKIRIGLGWPSLSSKDCGFRLGRTLETE